MQDDSAADFVFGSFAIGEVDSILANCDADDAEQQQQPQKEEVPQPKAAPKSWASLASSSAGSKEVKPTVPMKGLLSSPETLGEFCASYTLRTEQPQMLSRGLTNTGNACFRNVIMQTFLALPPLVNFVLELSRTYSFSAINSTLPAWAQITALVKEFEEPSLASASSYKTHSFARVPSLVPDHFIGGLIRSFQRENTGQQEDAQEFLTFILDQLHEEMAALAALQSTVHHCTNGTQEVEDAWVEVGKSGAVAVDERARTEHTSEQSSVIAKLFHGTFRSEVTKSARRSTTATFQRFATLSLNIDSPAVTDLSQALTTFFQKEAVQKAQLSTKIERLPPVLIVHLKRFGFDASSSAIVKIDKAIRSGPTLEIPDQALSTDLSAQIAISTSAHKPTTYQLISVIVHHGRRTSGGHYTCYVRDNLGEWRLYDDTRVEVVTLQTALAAAANAYLLFFCQSHLLSA